MKQECNCQITGELNYEIDRLRVELEETHTELAISIKERLDLGKQLAEVKGAEVCYNETISDLRESLAEARAEINRRDEFCGKCENGQLVALEQARQEAARECMRVCDDLEDEGYHYETCCHLTVRDRIKAKFGLEG